VSFVARTVVVPVGVPSGAGQVKDTASDVASQGMPPPTDRLFAVTVYVTVVPLGTIGSGGIRLIWMSRAFWLQVGGLRCIGETDLLRGTGVEPPAARV
jgi:hypothetical protein